MNQDTVIIIVGPTAAGKTAASILLAEKLQTEIISADSRQCFKELNIGVAKPSDRELAAAHHYFINSHSIRDEVTAATFEELALGWARHIFPRTVVMVGGTGLYIKAFSEGLDPIPAADPAIRRQIQQHYEQEGISWLQDQVRQSDPDFYSSGEIHNPQRLMRALEVQLSTGHSILRYRNHQPQKRPFHIRKIGLELPRQALNERIGTRVDRMMADGLLEEVRSLLPFRDLNALHTVGYTELFEHLDGKISLDQAVENIKTNTRRYAKRQMTWFRKDPSIQWIDAGIPQAILEII